MDILGEMIKALDRKDVKQYKVFSARSASEESRKDIMLFDFIRKSGGAYEEDKIFRKLYEGDDKNAFYRLKNRIAEDLGKSILLQQYREDELAYCFYLLSLGHFFFKKDVYKLSFTFYRKAEKQASELEDFGLLDIVYSRMITLSKKMMLVNLEQYIMKRKENRDKLRKMSELEDILKIVEYRMKLSQNYSQSQASLQQMLQKTIDEYTQDEELKNSGRLQLAIHNIVAQTLLQKKDYLALEAYLSQTYRDFIEKGFFNKNTHHQKLQLLTWLANAAFKNKNYQQSLGYAGELINEMERYDKMLYNNFLLFYYNVLVINFSEINLQKAIEILEDLTKSSSEKQPYYGLFIYLNLALFYFQQKNFMASLKALRKLYKHSAYENTDQGLRLKISLGELMLQYELNEKEVARYRLKQVLKDFDEQLQKEELTREKAFLEFYDMLISDKYSSAMKELVTQVKAYFSKHKEGAEQEDELLFRYNDWLKEKLHLL